MQSCQCGNGFVVVVAFVIVTVDTVEAAVAVAVCWPGCLVVVICFVVVVGHC